MEMGYSNEAEPPINELVSQISVGYQQYRKHSNTQLRNIWRKKYNLFIITRVLKIKVCIGIGQKERPRHTCICIKRAKASISKVFHNVDQGYK